MEKKVQAKARVQITVEIEASSWGGDCPISQLYKQAAEDGLAKVRNLRYSHNGAFTGHLIIIGEPRVIGVITEST